MRRRPAMLEAALLDRRRSRAAKSDWRHSMAVRRDEKQIKKDQQGPREVREEVSELIRDGSDSSPIIRNPNRDQARGDWDRTGDHHDEDVDQQ
jgi:hypothetical protein